MGSRKKGCSLHDGQAHDHQHQAWSRRDFLRTTGLAALGTPFLLGGHPLNILKPSPFLQALAQGDPERILVLIRLKGGNDGLNMVIPRGNSTYYNIRPTLAVQENALWGLNAQVGMPNWMSALQPMWEEGSMKVIQNVGYPEPNYSHFRASDIWASSSDSETVVNTGFIGRWLEQEFPGFLDSPPTVPPALEIGVQTNLIFKANSAIMSLSVSNPAEFYQIAQSGRLYSVAGLGDSPKDRELYFMRTVANSAFRYAETIKDSYTRTGNEAEYPDNDLAEQLAIVARLIKGNLGTRIYMVSIDGFDTHAGQLDYHPLLLQYLATSVAAFYKDLDKSNLGDKVLGMTFSEFGRTIFENGSAGTDHGTGAPMLLFARNLGKDVLGTPPDLDNPGEYGDPDFSTDFRDVYASVLGGWMGIDPTLADFSLGDQRNPMPGIFPQGNIPLGSNANEVLLGHNPDPQAPSIRLIKYAIGARGNVRLQILSEKGQPLRELENTFKEKGVYTYRLDPARLLLASGTYMYRLDTGGKVYSRKIRL